MEFVRKFCSQLCSFVSMYQWIMCNVQPVRMKKQTIPSRDPVVHETSQTTNQKTTTESNAHPLQLLTCVLARLSGLLGQQVGVNVGQDTTLGDRDVTEQLV
jgi:hypothetical protein